MKKSLVILIVAALCLVLSCGVVVFAVDDSQVLIAKDYFDQVVATLASKSYVDETFVTKTYSDENLVTKSYAGENLVTKSYADESLASKSYVDEKISTSAGTSSSGATAEYIVLELKKNAVVSFGASAEVILRSGSAKTVIPSTAEGGFADLTGGNNISNGKSVTLNHLLLVPRDDGRSLQVTSNVAYIMVRGSYTIQ